MTLPDTNIWLALSLSGHTHHEAAKAWLDTESARESICFCRSTQQSMLRLLTTSGVMAVYGISPLSNAAAWGIYEQFVSDDRIAFCAEPPRMNAAWKKLAARRTSSPKLWMDAYLAAFAITGGMQLVTTDKAFTQFPGLDALVISAS
jgi:toxin-antitoxin system PIN domain toxin